MVVPRLLPDLIKLDDYKVVKSDQEKLHGLTGSKGKAQGKVVIVEPEQINNVEFSKGDILVSEITTPDYLPLMKQAGGIITEKGGILSHAAIIARELSIPCIVNVQNARQLLKDVSEVEIDADQAQIKLI